MHLPTSVEKIKLMGTPAQCKWAKTIRLKRAVTMQKGGIKTLALAIKPHVSDDDLRAMRCNTIKHLSGFTQAVAQYMLSCPHARWWIDHRDDLPYHNVADAARICVEHFTRTKPFK